VSLVTADFFSMLHTAPVLGRDFVPEDAGVDIGYVLILSHAAWQRMYGGDPSVIGTTVEVDEDPFTVIGVMPEGFAHPGQPPGAPIDAWAPFDPTSSLFGSRSYRPLDVYGRLAPGVGVEESGAPLPRRRAP
jgi:putative ABC transport system permease protein